MFALLLVGLGLLFLMTGVLTTVKGGDVAVKTIDKGATHALPDKLGKTSYASGRIVGLNTMMFGFVLLSLGTAMNLGLRRVLRNGGEDVLEPHDPAGEFVTT